jgi:ligand-binding sensor domain-containing protein
MLLTYRILEQIAKTGFSDIVKNTALIGGKSAQPNKLRVFLIDGSFLDVWLSDEFDYSFHWEQRAVRGLIHRWDNAPDHPEVESFPHHFHDGKENNILSSQLNDDMKDAFKDVLGFIRAKLKACL